MLVQTSVIYILRLKWIFAWLIISKIRPILVNENSIFVFLLSGGLFTPDQAFDVIVRDRIARLLAPSLACVDQVVTKLSTIVHACLGQVGDIMNLICHYYLNPCQTVPYQVPPKTYFNCVFAIAWPIKVLCFKPVKLKLRIHLPLYRYIIGQKRWIIEISCRYCWC